MKTANKLIIITIIAILAISLVYASAFVDDSESEFNQGTYSNTEWNTDHIELSSGQTSGLYTSAVLDAVNASTWNSISWTQSDIGELENNTSNNVLLMHMNEASGNIIDYSSNNNDGTYSGNSYSQTGKINTAIGFDGINDRISIADDGDLSFSAVESFTLAAWVKLSSKDNNQHIFFKGVNGVPGIEYSTLYLASTDTFRFYTADSSSTSYVEENSGIGTKSLNTWYHVVGVYNASTDRVSIYVNGIGSTSPTAAKNGYVGSSQSLGIGCTPYEHSPKWMNGSIDEAAIWDNALSESEIEDLYVRGITRLNLTARSCDDDVCSGESWTDIADNSPQDLSVSDNQYFQYKFELTTEDTNYSPELYDVTISYEEIDLGLPVVNLESPADNTINTTDNTPDFTFTVTDETAQSLDCTLWLDNGAANAYGTDSSVLDGTSTTITADSNLANDDYLWWINCSDGQNTNISEKRNISINVTSPISKKFAWVTEEHHVFTRLGENHTFSNEQIQYWINWSLDYNPDFVFNTGDLVDKGDNYSDWTSFFEEVKTIESGTGVDEYWYTSGNHDGVFASDNFGAMAYGVSQMYRRGNKTSMWYSITKGNNAFIFVGMFNMPDEWTSDWQGSGREYFVPLHQREWLKNEIDYYEAMDYNIFILEHTPLYDSSSYTHTWYEQDTTSWINYSTWMKDMLETRSVDVLFSGHVHTDYEDYYSGHADESKGKIVWGSSTDRLPNETVFVNGGAICWNTGTAGTADYPTATIFNLTEGEEHIVLQAVNVETDALVQLSVNDTEDLYYSLNIALDHAVDLGSNPENNEIDSFRQAWDISQYSDESGIYQWYKPEHSGLWVQGDSWIISRWRFNEDKSFNHLSVATEDCSGDSCNVTHKFASGNSLDNWTQWYDDIISVPANKYWKVNTSFDVSSPIYVINLDLQFDDEAPIVYLESPIQGYEETTDNTPDFTFNVTDDAASVLSCILWLDNGTAATYGTDDISIGVSSTITANSILVNDNYLWWINCSDGVNNMNVSGTRNLIMNISEPTANKITFLTNDGADPTEYGYENGGLDETFYNISAHGLQLNASQTSGRYTSEVFDAGQTSQWNNISWAQSNIGELENNTANNVLLMHMNEASGNIIDYSGNNNDGTYSGNSYSQTGKINNAMGFDGINDRISIADNGDLSFSASESFTLAAWVKIYSKHNNQHIFFKGINSGASGTEYSTNYISSTDAFRIYLSSGSVFSYVQEEDSIGAKSLDTWYHVVGVYNASTDRASIYVNGIGSTSATTVSNGNTDTSHPLGIGCTAFEVSPKCLNGSIDEAAVWNRALSESEIKDLYARGLTRLNLTARSCDDDVCSGESWTDVSDTSPQDLDVDNNTYFQYKFDFETEDASYSPRLHNVTINYEEGYDCTPSLVNTSWSSWTNISCLANDKMNQSMEIIQYDENNCGAANQTFTEYRAIEDCDYCTQNMVNTSWSSWANITACQMNDTVLQERSRIEYDDNYCGEIGNTTFYDYQAGSCEYYIQITLNISREVYNGFADYCAANSLSIDQEVENYMSSQS